MFKYFWVTEAQLPADVGAEAFGPEHLAWLLGTALAALGAALVYRHLCSKDRLLFARALAVLIVLSELVKDVFLISAGSFTVGNLPLHLCGLSIFVCLLDAFQPSPVIREILYCLVLPGALAALLFPDWLRYPMMSFQSLQSFSIHLMLVVYAVLKLASGELRPRWGLLPKCFAALLACALPMYFFNKLCHTNFMFLNTPSVGSPLVIFEQWCGNPGYLLPLVGLLLLVWFLLYLPWAFGKQSPHRRGDWHWFHVLCWSILRPLAGPYVRGKFGYRCETVPRRKEPFIVLANHTTNWDPLFLGLAFKNQLYFVAGEQLSRLGIASALLRAVFDPILRVKARTEAHTAAEILHALRSGENVAMFPEGSTTWNGETSPLPPATAKLVKKSGAALLLYRIESGYFSLPRWSRDIRKGGMRGVFVKEYSAAQLSAMSTEEISKAIDSGLYYSAYEDVSIRDNEYICDQQARHLEAALFVCPCCKGLGTLSSAGQEFSCSCGLRLALDGHYRFASLTREPAPFANILEWEHWQRAYVAQLGPVLAQSPPDSAVTSDDEQELCRVDVRKRAEILGHGTLALYSDRLEVACPTHTYVFPLSDITDMAIITRWTLCFSCSGDYYELRSANPHSALKYVLLAGVMTKLRAMI